MGARRPLWRALQERVHNWRQLGASEFICRAIPFGVFDQPKDRFVPGQGLEMGNIPQDEEELSFARKDLEEGCQTGFYRKISHDHAMEAKRQGAVISSSFTV